MVVGIWSRRARIAGGKRRGDRLIERCLPNLAFFVRRVLMFCVLDCHCRSPDGSTFHVRRFAKAGCSSRGDAVDGKLLPYAADALLITLDPPRSEERRV